MDDDELTKMTNNLSEYELTRASVIERIICENCSSCQEWGNEFDSKNTINDWVSFITMYASDAAKIRMTKEEQKKYLVKAANLCISALVAAEMNDGFPDRHYD